MQATLNQYIELRPNRRGVSRPYVAGSRVRVQDIVLDSERHGYTVDEIALQYPSLSHAQIHSALAYYFDHKDELWQAIREDEAYAESLRDSLISATQSSGSQDGDSLSS